MRRKYGNIKCEYRGIKFDSKKEMYRYIELKSMLDKGEITLLLTQSKMEVTINNKHICYLILDFVYTKNGVEHYEDVKALDRKTGKFLTTPVFNLKRKLVEAQYGIKIELK